MGVGQAGGMRCVVCLRATRGGGMENVGRLGAERGGGMAEAGPVWECDRVGEWDTFHMCADLICG